MGSSYLNSIQTSLNAKLGEDPSIVDYGAKVGQDSTEAFAEAIAAAMASPLASRRIYIPQGLYLVSAAVAFNQNVSGIRFYGDGASSIVQATGKIAQGVGVFDIQAGASDISFEDMTVDGGITTPVGLMESQFSSDEVSPVLTQNTSFWVHGGASNVSLRNVTIQHTGGYAFLAYADSADITGLRLVRCHVINCRPNLFGTVATDLNYGAWNAGFLFDGEGNSYACSDVLVDGCSFERVAGTALWTHLKNLNWLHSNIRFVNNHFLDIGLDCIQWAGVYGGECADNSGRRSGFVTYDDTSQSVPRWGGFQESTALDTAGLTIGVDYHGNSFVSLNGLGINLDGYARGNVYGNSIVNPYPSDPQYTQDQMSLAGPGQDGQNWTQGCFSGNTDNNPIAGTDINVYGNTFVNCGGGAVGMYAARGCNIYGNNIDHPSAPNFAPIALGNIGAGGAYQRSYNNVVTENVIQYSPASAAPAIFEDSQYASFQLGDKNWIFANHIIPSGSGNGLSTEYAYEFEKAFLTFSECEIRISSGNGPYSDVLLDNDGGLFTVSTVTGPGPSDSVGTLGVTAISVCSSASGYSATVATYAGSGLGAFVTGGRQGGLNALVDDCILTGKLVGDAFAAVYAHDQSGGTYSDTDANKYGANWGLLRYSQVNSRWEQSVTVSAGARVWSPLVPASTSPGTPAGSLQFNSNPAGTFTGSVNAIYNPTSQLLTLIGLTGTAGLDVQSSFIQSDQGFYSTSSAVTALNLPSGGGQLGLGLQVNQAYWMKSLGLTPTSTQLPNPTSGYGGLAYATGSQYFYWNGTAYALVNLSTVTGNSPGGSANAVQFNSNPSGTFDGSGNFTWNNTAQELAIIGMSGQAAITTTAGYIQSAGGFASTINSWEAFNGAVSGSGSYLAGMSVGVYSSTGGYLDLNVLGYANYPVPLNGLSSFGSTDVLLWASGTNGTATANTTYGLMTNAFINAAAGFSTLSTNPDAIQASNGGVLTQYLTLHTGVPTGNKYPTAIFYADSSTVYGRVFGSVVSSDYGTLYIGTNVSYSGSAWVTDSSSLNSALIGMDPGSSIPFTVYIGTGSGLGVSALQIHQSGNVGIQGAPSTIAGQALSVTGSSGQPGVILSGGYMQSAQGFYSPYNSVTTINVPSGGAQFGLDVQMRNMYVLGQSSAPANPTAGYGGLSWESGTNYWYWNGSGWATVNLLTAGGGVSSVTASGSGISVSPTTGAVIIENTGVTSLVGGSGISLSGSTGAVTVTNSGVTSLVAGTGITLSSSTGAVTVSIGQSVAITANVTFANIVGSAVYMTDTVFNALATAGGLAVRTNSSGSGGSGASVNDMTSNGSVVINSSHAFVGSGGVDVSNTVTCTGVSCSGGVACTGVNPNGGYFGQTWTINIPGGFTISGVGGTFHNLVFVGGVLVSAS